MKEDNSIIALRSVLGTLNARVSERSLQEIKNYPGYPSLKTISECLEEWNIENVSVRLSSHQLQEIPYPAIAHFHKNGGHYVVLQKIENDRMHYFDSDVGVMSESLKSFENKWSGALLLLSVNEKSGERDYKQNHREEVLSKVRKAVLLFLLTLITITPVFVIGFKTALLLWVIKVVGAIFSIILLLYQFNSTGDWAASICKIGKKADCERVLSSPAAKIFGIGMAEFGSIYFVGGMISYLMSVIGSANISPILAFMSLCCLPYTLFSIYYQWRKIKVWCPLCLGVLLVLWLEFLINSQNLKRIDSIHAQTLYTVLFGYLLPLVFWMTVRPSLRISFAFTALHRELGRFKRNEKVFKSLLKDEPSLAPGNFGKEIELGDVSSPFCITVITNPTCGPCGQAHYTIKNILSQFKGRVKVRLRFAVNQNNDGSTSSMIVKRIIGAYLKTPQTIESVIDSWYLQRKRSKEATTQLQKNHSIDSQHEDQIARIFTEHSKWFASSGISATPTFFLGDKRMPQEYRFSDLNYLVRYWLEEEAI